MQIIKRDRYISELQDIMGFIAKDSTDRALKFEDDIEEKLNNLPNMPYKFRQSLYFNDKQIRDLIFKGYVVPYLIDKQNNLIVILGINKYKIYKLNL
jgi:plasmid stabilization system protein ParE